MSVRLEKGLAYTMMTRGNEIAMRPEQRTSREPGFSEFGGQLVGLEGSGRGRRGKAGLRVSDEKS